MEIKGNWKDALANLQANDENLQTPFEEERPTTKEEKSIKKQNLSIGIDKKGRSGKTATLIYGWDGTDEELEQFAKHLKAKLGIGGSTRDGEILLQGDLREKLMKVLTEEGHKVKRRN